MLSSSHCTVARCFSPSTKPRIPRKVPSIMDDRNQLLSSPSHSFGTYASTLPVKKSFAEVPESPISQIIVPFGKVSLIISKRTGVS